MSARRGSALTGALLVLIVAAPHAPSLARGKDTLPIAELPDWVREAREREVTHKGHDVTWLHREALVEPRAEGGVRVVTRIAGRVVRDPGREILGSWSVVYEKGDEVVAQKAWNILSESTVRVAHPVRNVYDRPAISGYSVFEDTRSRTIEPPGVQVGSLVAYEFEKIIAFDRGAFSWFFGTADEPTALTRLTLRVPPGWEAKIVQVRTEHTEILLTEGAGEITATALDLPPLPRDELRPPADEVLPLIWAHWSSPDGTRGFKDWNAVARWYEELSRPVLGEPGEAAEIGKRLAPRDPALLKQALGEAFAFAAREVRYVSIQVGIGGFKPFSPAEVCRLRYGDCKAKTFLMRALVEPWGLTSHPVLVRTASSGPLAEDVPSAAQFDHAIAALRMPEGIVDDLWTTLEVEGLGRVLLLDATAHASSPWELPDAVQGTTALLVTPGGGRLIHIPDQPPAASRATCRLMASIDDGGALTQATLVESWTGQAAAGIRGYYAGQTAENHRRRVLIDLQERFPGTVIEDYRIEGLHEVEEAVVETTRLTGGRLGQRLSDLLVLKPSGLAHGLMRRKLPPPPRPWPLELGPPREESIEIAIELPDGWVPEALPEPLRLQSPDIEAETEWTLADRTLVYRRTARLRVSRLPPERYAVFHAAVSTLQDEDSRAVVLVPQRPD